MAIKVTKTLMNPQALNNQAALQYGLAAALNKVKERIQDKFQNNPGSWKPLTPFTIRDRRAKGFGPTPILYRTGRLKGAAVQEIAIETGSGYVSTNDAIAIMQDPARPFYELSEEDLQAVDEAFIKAFEANW
jgi:hypothetical protein